MYNAIAKRYDIADQFGSISKSHTIAIKQIETVMKDHHLPVKVLDMGIGNGAFLQQLLPILKQAKLTGIDISPEMIKLAQENLPILCIEGSATEASHYLPAHSQDLILAHFINAYIPIDTLLQQANLLTRSNGYFSMITTTYESFPEAQRMIAEFINDGSIVGRLVGHYYKNLVRNTTVSSGLEDLFCSFDNHGFKVVEHQRLEIPFQLNNIDDLILFGIDGTWFLNSISMRMLPKQFLIERLKRLFERIFTFPYKDTHIIDIILASK
jgi:ubiquinone/menaquinone biosynthesis C-methylase UbiE